MIRPVPLVALLAIAAGSAPATARDARLTQRLYDADTVVRIEGRVGVQASIAFAEDEHIENVAVGDAESWQITPNKRANLLFVKPLAATARTNLTVVTDQRAYYFDLVASPRAAPIYALRFTYPAETKKPTPQIGTLNEAERQALAGRDAPVDPAALNFAWRTSGEAKLLPARIYDDGNATYALWAIDTPLPAIQVTDEKGVEGPVNFAVRGDTIVIEGVPQRIVLRAGKARAMLEYRGPDLAGRRVRSAVPATAPSAATAPLASAAPQITSRSE